MKIGIITFYKAINYGAVLQSYALQKTLSNLGYDVEIIDYVCDELKQNYKIFKLNNKTAKEIVSSCIYLPIKMIRKRKFLNFIRKNIKLSEEKNILKSQLTQIGKNYDFIITGSDQVWNPELTSYDGSYFLDFVDDGKKIAYAASLGTDSPSKKENEFYLTNIQGYRIKTVREEDSAQFLSRLLNEPVDTACDPVFLLSKSEWISIFNTKPIINKPYIFVYCLHEKSGYKYAEELAKRKNLKIVCIPPSLKDVINGKKNITAGVETFLNYIYNANYVITDSFHATAFSLIFNKSLDIVLKSKYKKLNGRLKAIAKQFDIEYCLLNEKTIINVELKQIDYTNVNKIIECLRKKAIGILNFNGEK